MICPNCGAEMKEGSLYCEHCGEDIHIVPDFEPELEYDLEQPLIDLVQELQEPSENTDTEKESDAVPEEELFQDWDSPEGVKPVGKRKSQLKWLLVGVFIGLLLVGAASVLGITRYHSPEYQTAMAERCIEEQDFDKAVEYYERALELQPDNVNLKFSLAEVYFLKNNKIEYEFLLRDIVNDENASVEQLESAYGKLIAIYRAREDYLTINELLLASENERIISQYQSYIAVEPEFSVKEGNYTSIQPLKLTTSGSGKIYYTMDGSEPDENSSMYTAPILLEDGEYCVKAIYINERGIASNVVTKKYFIEIEMLPSPEISAVSGDYNFPIRIEVLSETESVYYTTNGTTPDVNSNLYTGSIPMPLGNSVFKFIHIEDGRSSEVVERTYNLTMNTTFTPEQAVRDVIQYSIDTGKIYDETGHFDESDAAYKYEYQYVTNINEVDDFYVISEVYRDAENVLTKTGNNFAVNAYTKEILKLQTDEYGNFILVEIEKEPQ